MSCRRAVVRPARAIVQGTTKQQTRRLSLHQYQSQNLLKEHNVSVPQARVVTTPGDAEVAARDLGGRCVVNPQILGNRQHGTVLSSTTDVRALASRVLGQRDGSAPRPDKIYIAEHVKHHDGWHIAMAIDRENYSPVILLAKDGTSIGSQAQRFHFGLSEGITTRLIQVIAKSLQTTPEETTQLQNILQGLYKIFVEKDATHLEINPLGRTPTQRLLAIDSNFTIDDAASKRQKDLFDLRDTTHEVAEEVEAEKYGLVYVRMDGNIGNVVNGAGLAMATNDAIGLYGGASANFLDAGGQATKETMQQAFRIILNDERVKSILVNIYGGITRCDMIAESIIAAASDMGPMRVPVVVRLQGTNSEEGLKLLEKANLGLHVVADFGEAAKTAMELAKV